MRRTALLFVFLLSVGLGACSLDEAGEKIKVAVTSPEGASKQQKEKRTSTDIQLDEPFELSTVTGDKAIVTIKELTLGEECRFGSYATGIQIDELAEGEQYLQILAEVEAQASESPQSIGSVILTAPKTVDAEQFTKDAEFAIDCRPDEGYEHWGLPTKAGDKTRRYGAFVVPEGTKEIRIEGNTCTVQ